MTVPDMLFSICVNDEFEVGEFNIEVELTFVKFPEPFHAKIIFWIRSASLTFMEKLRLSPFVGLASFFEFAGNVEGVSAMVIKVKFMAQLLEVSQTSTEA